MSSGQPPQPPPARTEQERERERAERARRRSAHDAAADTPPPGAFAPPLPPPEARSAAAAPGPPAGGAGSGDGQASARRRRGAAARALALVGLAVIALAVWLGLERSGNSERAQPVTVPVVVRVLIPEGESRPQIAERASAAGLKGSYLQASKRSPLLHPAAYGAPARTPNLEGFLFPATYDLYRGDPAARLVREQLVAFRENFGATEEARARALHITPYQLLIVASIIEREAQLPGDRAKVAAVIYNRLRLGMPLGIDSTIRYALNDYTQPLTDSQLALDSPYNTRLHTGLPPTPISNPGVAAMRAAAHPAHVGYLYYVAGADGCGEQVFSTSYAQFERDAAAYHQALRENGGRVPTCRAGP